MFTATYRTDLATASLLGTPAPALRPRAAYGSTDLAARSRGPVDSRFLRVSTPRSHGGDSRSTTSSTYADGGALRKARVASDGWSRCSRLNASIAAVNSSSGPSSSADGMPLSSKTLPVCRK